MAKESYLSFETEGLDTSQITTSVKGNIFYVFTSGGFINVHSTASFRNLANKFYLKAYFNGKNKVDIKGGNKFKPDGSAVYLLPDSEFFIDVLEQKTDSLVCRYIVKRTKLIPKINFYKLANGKKVLFYTSSESALYDGFSISPREKICISPVGRNDFKNLKVEYRLINLKTKRSVVGQLQDGFDTLKLEANTDYEFRMNYTAQQELSSVISIKVKPYWYQSVFTYVLLSICILVVAFLFISGNLKDKLRRSRKEQQKMEEAAIRLQSLLNPHFTFNALSSIQGLMNTNRIDDANYYLQEFSSLLRKTLAKSQSVYNSLDQELEMMRMYIRLEALRFDFVWDIEIDGELNISEIEIPTLLLQPIIENAIKHGLSNLGNKGKLIVVCKKGQKENSFVIVVQDNGVWLDNTSSNGYGLSLTEERIHTINKLNKEQNVELEFNRQSGTQAILTFHNWINI